MVGVAGGSRGCANCKKRKLKVFESDSMKSQRDCNGPVVGPMFRKQRVGVHGKTYISFVANKSSLSIDHNHESSRRRNLLVTEVISSYPISSASFEQSTTSKLTFTSTSIPRGLMLFPEFDLYNHCFKMFLDRYSVASHPNRFGELLNLVLSHVPSSTTFASRALVISYCSSLYRDPDIALLGSSWYYIQALRYQKELVKLMTCSPGYSFRIKHSSERGLDDTISVEADSISASSCLTKWASTDNPFICKPSKNTTSTPLDLPVMTTDLSVSSMRGNMMSYEDDSITAGLLLTVYEVFNSSTNASWISLLSGANELMRIRGPQAVRGIMAVLALVIHKNTFLNDPEWKTSHHYLVDLVLEVPQYQEIVERVLIYSFAKDETHLKLTDLEGRLEMWLQEYCHGAREYAREHLVLPLTVTFDPMTATPNIPQPRCPATISDADYPIVNYATMRDARIMATYHTTRMIIAYLQQLTVRFDYLEFDNSLDLFPGKRYADLDVYVEN
ncbi:hypothetical protein V1508DRAFT_406843 [Lipomyces doorenjongii]|uniref:uncharacterized protein n=1 Tax=Lipomyces doorenjongii TaxID=383834 RepID=UPI0034CEA333